MDNIREKISEYNEDAIIFDGIDEAIIGVGEICGKQPVVVYDRIKCIEILAQNFQHDSDDENYSQENALDDALEWFEFNIAGAYVGENTPIFMDVFKKDNGCI